MTYYLIAFSLYFLILFILFRCFMHLSPDNRKKFKDVLKEEKIKISDVIRLYLRLLFLQVVKEKMKTWDKSEHKSRKKRIRALPLYQRFLFWFWYDTVFIMIFLPAILFSVLRYYLIADLYIPASAMDFSVGGPALLLFGVGSFLVGISLDVGYSYLTNRGIIREADRLYSVGSFQEYPKEANVFISVILVAIGGLIMIFSFNCYDYITPEKMAFKPAFAMSEKIYAYADIDDMEKTIYSDGEVSYAAHFVDGKKHTFSIDKSIENPLDSILKEYNIETVLKVKRPLMENEEEQPV